MHLAFSFLEAIGAWLLFIFPLYQAMLELDEQVEKVKNKEKNAIKKIKTIPKVAPLYWIWPPLKIKLEKKRMLKILSLYDISNDQLEIFSRLVDKATAWFYVALGALLVAIANTHEVFVELYPSLSLEIFWIIIIVITILGIMLDRYRMSDYRIKKFIYELKDTFNQTKKK
ncbi:hypothetical protein GCM10022297_04840 [Lactobacillus hamsteri]|uniref:Uncharacterized protein n=1 Tax=Lactobacillus hamsteri DSM 5661 = JCM 6256 TaxID=1423754 RepID=A0A0R1YDM9_9LACO|nr:hypothetical protein [Lactobacillus hamsteri]KRM40477.1 hypothetical protein FC39_GL000619 [Lactobacillus hamsteri DSM 5661 = JCM 6256]